MNPGDQSTGRDPILMVALIVLVAALVGGVMYLAANRRPAIGPAGNSCVNNLRQIAGAKEQWALEHKHTNGTLVPIPRLVPYLKGNALPPCPQGGLYTVGKVGEPPTCSVTGHTL